jgi:branched-chain amino acid aminotransferase
MHRYLLHNDDIRDTTEALLSPGQIGFLSGWGVFSTLRVARGVLFEFERHYARMRYDAIRLRVPFEISSGSLKKSLLALVDANQASEATLRVAVVRNKGGFFQSPGLSRDCDLVAFTKDLAEWGEGARLSYVRGARFSACPFAGAKTISWAQNLTLYEEAHERGFDEVILLNERDQVSECTSANLFAIEGDHVWTPPLASSGCLPGVTRAVLLEEIRVPGFSIGERELSPDELESSRQVFMTSSTRDLLPVVAIDERSLQQDRETLGVLQRAFRDYREAYVAAHARAKESLGV